MPAKKKTVDVKKKVHQKGTARGKKSQSSDRKAKSKQVKSTRKRQNPNSGKATFKPVISASNNPALVSRKLNIAKEHDTMLSTIEKKGMEIATLSAANRVYGKQVRTLAKFVQPLLDVHYTISDTRPESDRNDYLFELNVSEINGIPKLAKSISTLIETNVSMAAINLKLIRTVFGLENRQGRQGEIIEILEKCSAAFSKKMPALFELADILEAARTIIKNRAPAADKTKYFSVSHHRLAAITMHLTDLSTELTNLSSKLVTQHCTLISNSGGTRRVSFKVA